MNKKRSGFRITLKNIDIHVDFRNYNDKIVKCIMTYDLPMFDMWNIVTTGYAKLHPDDIFNLQDGRELAFEYAMEKFVDKFSSERDKFVTKYNKDKMFIMESVRNRADKFLRRGK